MKRRPKGFDPLAGLFQTDATLSAEEPSIEPLPEPSQAHVPTVVELTDPVFAPPFDNAMSTPPPSNAPGWVLEESFDYNGAMRAPADIAEPDDQLREPMIEDIAEADPGLLDLPGTGEEAVPPDPSFVEPVIGPEQPVSILEAEPESAIELSPTAPELPAQVEIQTSQAEPAPVAEPAGPDPVALARALGRAAAAAAARRPENQKPASKPLPQTPRPPQGLTSVVPASPAAAPRPAAPRPAAPRPAPVVAPPPGPSANRSKSPEDIVAEALRRENAQREPRAPAPAVARVPHAAVAPAVPRPLVAPQTPAPLAPVPLAPAPLVTPPETPAPVAPAPEIPALLITPPVQELARQVEVLLGSKLKSVQNLKVLKCIVAEDRELLRALWKAHYMRFAAEGRLEQVLGAVAVINALRRVPEGRLAVAHALTGSSDYLVWLDLGDGTPIAAFSDARALFVGA